MCSTRKELKLHVKMKGVQKDEEIYKSIKQRLEKEENYFFTYLISLRSVPSMAVNTNCVAVSSNLHATCFLKARNVVLRGQ